MTNMGKSYDMEIRVKWGEVDLSGIIFFPKYFEWMDEGVNQLFRSLGFQHTKEGKLLIDGEVIDASFAFGEFHLRVDVPSYLDDCLILRTTAQEIKEKTITFEFQLLKKEEGKILAKGWMTAIWIDSKSFKSVMIPEKIVKLII